MRMLAETCLTFKLRIYMYIKRERDGSYGIIPHNISVAITVMWSRIILVFLSSLSIVCRAQYGLFGNYDCRLYTNRNTKITNSGTGGLNNYLANPFAPPLYGYGGNPMMAIPPTQFLNTAPSLASAYPTTCTDSSPQCSLWASTGQCASNPLMMRSTCALSCGTCLTGQLPTVISPLSYPMGFGVGGGGIPSMGYPMYGQVSPYMGRSIYETGILRQPNPAAGPKIGSLPSMMSNPPKELAPSAAIPRFF